MRAISAAALLLVLLAIPAYAHHCRHHGCRHCDSRARPAGATAPTALKGEIAEVIYVPGSGSVEVILRAGSKTTTVKLAPSRFLKDNGIGLKEGQTLELKGFWVDTADGDLFIATSITTGSGDVILRNSRGRPRW